MGPSAEDLFRQAMQLILRKQLYVLIHELGFPPELEEVAREYWTLYMSLVTMHHEKRQKVHPEKASDNDNDTDESDEEDPGRKDRGSNYATEVDHDQFKDKTTVQETDQDAVDSMGEYQGYDTHESESSSEEESDQDQVEESDMDDATEGLDNDGIHAGAFSRTKRVAAKPLRADPQVLAIIFTLVVCYFSATHLKLPVVLGDFTR